MDGGVGNTAVGEMRGGVAVIAVMVMIVQRSTSGMFRRIEELAKLFLHARWDQMFTVIKRCG
jgi:hypothetical protein